MNSEIWLRAQYQAVVRERDNLQNQLELKQKENEDLRKSVFELSYLMSLQCASGNAFKIGDRLCRDNSTLQGTAPILNRTKDLPMPLLADNITADERYLKLDAEMKGHSGAIYCAAFSSGGRWLASGSIDRTVRVWDGGQPYKQTACFTDHTQLVSDVCWEQGSKQNRLLSISYDRTVRLWDTERSTCMGVTKLRAFGSLVKTCSPSAGNL
eukprot:gene7564-15509_t